LTRPTLSIGSTERVENIPGWREGVESLNIVERPGVASRFALPRFTPEWGPEHGASIVLRNAMAVADAFGAHTILTPAASLLP
jgi:hypothetical protein